MRRRIEGHAEALFRKLGTQPIPEPTPLSWQLPPIDHEDRNQQPVRSRQLVWTTPIWQPEQVGALYFTREPQLASQYFDTLAAATPVILRHAAPSPVDGETAVSSLPTGTLGLPLRLFSLAVVSWYDEVDSRRSFCALYNDWLSRFVPHPKRLRQLIESRIGQFDGSSFRRQFLLPPNADSPLRAWAEAVTALRASCLQHAAAETPEALEPVAAEDYRHLGSRLIHNALNPFGLRIPNEILLSRLFDRLYTDPEVTSA
ncbi:MAG: hypothetical protein AAF772_03120 [Acidobacteriota bacterium]